MHLRAGNVARKFNNYEKAITHFKKAIELDPLLIASYFNLVEIYLFRSKYYKIKKADIEAIFYLSEMWELFKTDDFSYSTLNCDENGLIQFIGDCSEKLNIQLPELVRIPERKKKIGRNERCPCGSGKKYKKCCLENVKPN